MKTNSTFTRNIQAQHDQTAIDPAYRGGTFTAEEAMKGRKRVSNSLGRTVISNRHNSPQKGVLGDGRLGLPQDRGVARKTGGFANRAQCIGENELADRICFE